MSAGKQPEIVRDGAAIYRGWFDVSEVAEIIDVSWGHLLTGIRLGVEEFNRGVVPERRFSLERRIVNVFGDADDVFDAFAKRLPLSGDQIPDSPQEIAHFPGSSGMPMHADLMGCWGPMEGWEWHYCVGITLTPSRVGGSCLYILVGSEEVPVELDPGDVIVFRADVPHRVESNETTAPRIALYYRLTCTPDELQRYAELAQ